MTRLIRDGVHVATVCKSATAAKPPWPSRGIASDASGELRERNFMKIVSLAPEVL
jgi:ribosomal protein L14